MKQKLKKKSGKQNHSCSRGNTTESPYGKIFPNSCLCLRKEGNPSCLLTLNTPSYICLFAYTIELKS